MNYLGKNPLIYLLQLIKNKFAQKDHTHNYAGSDSEGGIANSAYKLSSPQTINGVYFDGTNSIDVTATPKNVKLTNEDLNTIFTIGFYYGHNTNTCTNKPDGVGAFGLRTMFISGNPDPFQELISQSDGKIYYRMRKNNSWSDWAEIYTQLNQQIITKEDIGLENVENKSSMTILEELTKENVINALGYTPPITDTNTHYVSKNVVGTSSSIENTTTSISNGSVYLNSVENGSVTSSHKISGSGSTTVTTDTSGNIVVYSNSSSVGVTIINANTDLNTITTPGFYYCPANATVATLKNTPNGSGFFMIVGKHAGVYQEITTYPTTNEKKYIRNYYGGTWGSWYKVFTAIDPQTTISGNAGTSTQLLNERNIYGNGFDGTSDVEGQAIVYGNHEDEEETRYYHGGIQVRENDLVGNTETDISYAPSIGFHWQGKVGASIALDSDGKFNFIKQDGINNAEIKASNFVGDLSGTADHSNVSDSLSIDAGSLTNPIYFSDGKPVKTTYKLEKSVPSDAVFTDTNTWRGIEDNLTSASTTDSLSANQGKILKELIDGKAPNLHTHTKSQISDFPTSMPASDVYAWAKSTVKPTYTPTEVGLGDVENKSSATIRSELTKANVTTALGYTPPTTDTNTWRGIQDNLTSNSITDSLSANQGKILKGFIDEKAPISHSHTKSQITDFPTSLPASDVSAWAKASSKPSYTYSEVGADASGSASSALSNAKTYTDSKISELINDAPETLDTLSEIATAIEDNQEVVDTLNSAIGAKANTSDLVSHTDNKSNPHSVTKSQIGLGNVENKSSDTIRGELTKANVTTALGYTPPTSDTNTHYSSKNVVGSSTSTNNTTTTLSNGSVYLNSVENGIVTSSNKISGSGATSVTTDTSGNIIISSTDSNTVYTHPTATAYASGLYKITTNNLGHVTAATAVTKADITALGIPSSDTNTTYSVVTQSANGLMSSSDKTKLDGVSNGANNYSLPTATSSVLGGVKTGSNITNTSGVISLTKANVTSALGYTPPTTDTNTTYTLSSITGTLDTSKGGTGSTTGVGARKNIGATNIDYSLSEPSDQNVGDIWMKATTL